MVEENLAAGAAPQAGEGRNVNRGKNIRLFAYGIGGFLLLILAAGLGLELFRVYSQTAIDPMTVAVAKALRLPAFKVNGERILYSAYADDLKAIKIFQAYSKAQNEGAGDYTEEQLNDQVVSRLINNALLKKLIRDNGVTASEEDVNKVKEDIKKNFANEDDLNKELKSRYGWSFDEYTEKVIKPYILENKLGEVIAGNKEAIAKVQAKAEGVLEEVKKGADFAELAKKYSEDGTAEQGGDLDWFGKGSMVQQFEDVAFSLKPGEVSSELVQTEYGYHIIKAEDKRTTKVKNEKGKEVDQEEVRARHILFLYPSLSKYMRDMFSNAAIHIYIKVRNPFTNGQVQA